MMEVSVGKNAVNSAGMDLTVRQGRGGHGETRREQLCVVERLRRRIKCVGGKVLGTALLWLLVGGAQEAPLLGCLPRDKGRETD